MSDNLAMLGDILIEGDGSQLAHILRPTRHKIYTASSFTKEAFCQLYNGTARPNARWNHHLPVTTNRNPSEGISIKQVWSILHCTALLSVFLF